MLTPRIALSVLALTALAAFSPAQSPVPVGGAKKAPTKKEYGILNFETNVGSFKVLGAGEDLAEGLMEFSFNGTVLVSGLQGTVSVTGNVRKEYEDKKREKTVYFGKGKITINGKYKGVQFFGRELKGRQNGFGVFRFFGEFDRNLNTGNKWYEGYPKESWGSGGNTVVNPMPENMRRIVPKVKMSTGG